jgi:hypothetical protein
MAERKTVRRYFPCGQRCEASFTGEGQQQHNVVITERLFTASPPVLCLQDLGQTGSLRFYAEFQPASASFPTFVRSEVQNVQNLHTGMPKLPFLRRGGRFLAGSLKSKTA